MNKEHRAWLDKPLQDIHKLWVRFAIGIGGEVPYNSRSQPSREIVLRNKTALFRTISLSCVTKALGADGLPLGVLYFLYIFAYADSDHGRIHWASEVSRLGYEQVQPSILEPLLNQAWGKLQEIDLDYLRTHGRFDPFPPGMAVYPKDQKYRDWAPDDLDWN